EIDREAAFDLVEDEALHFLVGVECLLELAPAFLAPRLVARQHRFAQRVFDTLEIDFDLIADLEVSLPSRAGEFTQGHPTLGLQTDIDDGKFLFDADDLALDDGTFLQVSASKRFVEHLGEVFTRGCCSRSHGVSCLRRAGGFEWRSNCAGRWSRRPTAASGIPVGRRNNRAFGAMVRSGALYAEARAGLCPPTARGVTRALGPPGWPRRCRWRPGLPRLYPNALYRASTHPARALGAPRYGFDHARRALECPPALRIRRYFDLAHDIRRRGGARARRGLQ